MGNSPSLYSSDNESDMLDWGLEWCGSPAEDEMVSSTNHTWGEQQGEEDGGVAMDDDDNDDDFNVTDSTSKGSRTTFQSNSIDSSCSTPRRRKPNSRRSSSLQPGMDETPKRSNISSHTKNMLQADNDYDDDDDESITSKVFHSPRTAFTSAVMPTTTTALAEPPRGRVTPDEEVDEHSRAMQITKNHQTTKDDNAAKHSCSSSRRRPLKKRLVPQVPTNDTATMTTSTSPTDEQHSVQAPSCTRQDIVEATSNERETRKVFFKQSQHPFSSKKPKLYHRKYLPALKALAAVHQKSTIPTTIRPPTENEGMVPPTGSDPIGSITAPLAVLDTPPAVLDDNAMSIIDTTKGSNCLGDADEIKSSGTECYVFRPMSTTDSVRTIKDHLSHPEQHLNSVAGALDQKMTELKVVDNEDMARINESNMDLKTPAIERPSAVRNEKLCHIVRGEVVADTGLPMTADEKELNEATLDELIPQPMYVVIGSPHFTANYPTPGNRYLLNLCCKNRFRYYSSGDPLIFSHRHKKKKEMIRSLLYDMESQLDARFLQAETFERMPPNDVVIATEALMNLLPGPNHVVFLPYPTEHHPNGLVAAPDMFIAMLSEYYYNSKQPSATKCVRDIHRMRTYAPIRFLLADIHDALHFREVDETHRCLVQWYMDMAADAAQKAAGHDEVSSLPVESSSGQWSTL